MLIKVVGKIKQKNSCSQGFDGFFPVADPFLFEFPTTESRLRGRHPVKAHVRALVVVEVDGRLQRLSDLPDGEECHAHEQLVLDDAVDTLGHGVVPGVSALGHADPDVVLPQDVRIGIAGILDAPVRVVDEVFGRPASKALQGHFQRLDGEPGLQRLAHAPADDLLRVIVRDERQVAEVVVARLRAEVYHHVRDVAHPKLVGAKGNEFLHQVRIEGQVMAGVRGPGTAPPLAHLQVVALDDIVEAVIADTVLLTERRAVHLPELAAADAAVPAAHVLDKLHDERLLRQLAHLAVAVLVIGLG